MRKIKSWAWMSWFSERDRKHKLPCSKAYVLSSPMGIVITESVTDRLKRMYTITGYQWNNCYVPTFMMRPGYQILVVFILSKLYHTVCGQYSVDNEIKK